MQKRPLYKVEGIVIKRINIGEADKIITIFTKEKGKIVCIAKGIRKISSRRAPHLELFRHVLVTVYAGKTFDYIAEATSITNGFSDITLQTNSAYAYYLSEIIDKILPDHEPHVSIFIDFSHVFTTLIHSGHRIDQKIVLDFGLRMLRNLGYLSVEKNLSFEQMHTYIESIIERPLKTKKIFIEHS
jgi:DNA repair protein RecO (recombination protein O)